MVNILKPPIVRIKDWLYALFYFVGKIAKEIDARALLQNADRDGIVDIVAVVVRFVGMFCPEGQ